MCSLNMGKHRQAKLVITHPQICNGAVQNTSVWESWSGIDPGSCNPLGACPCGFLEEDASICVVSKVNLDADGVSTHLLKEWYGCE